MRTSCRLPKKRRAGLAGPRADPLVRAGDPARGDALGPAPHPPGPRDHLVVMAPRPSSRHKTLTSNVDHNCSASRFHKINSAWEVDRVESKPAVPQVRHW